MFDNLSDKFSNVFRKLSGQAFISEGNITEAIDDIRLALLDADVNYAIVNEFIEEIREECIGEKVVKSVTPGEQLVKIVNDKLIELMGTGESKFKLDEKTSVLMLVGLHGSGKTTTAAKLASHFKKNGKKVLLVAADIYRPAAIDQLEILGKEIGVQVYSDRFQPRVDILADKAKMHAKDMGADIVIIDTAGRFQIDEGMVQELISISNMVLPSETILVADSALGQEAVSVAEHFNKALSLTGVVLTKFDGDARGGAALSIKKITGAPIKMVGVGEKINDLEIFYPDRMASRILGMGDIVSLVEKANEEMDEREAERLEKKLKNNQFDLSDFLSQLRQLKKLGGMEKLLKFLPGGKALSKLPIDAKQFSSLEAIICSMTLKERETPELIDFSRRKRISNGAGVKLEHVNNLLKQFFMMKKVIKRPGLMNSMMNESGLSSGMPMMPSGGGMSGGFGKGPRNQPKKQKRKKNKKR